MPLPGAPAVQLLTGPPSIILQTFPLAGTWRPLRFWPLGYWAALQFIKCPHLNLSWICWPCSVSDSSPVALSIYSLNRFVLFCLFGILLLGIDGIDFERAVGEFVLFQSLKLIVMEGMCTLLALGGAENDRPLLRRGGGGRGPALILRHSWASASACGGLIC